MCGSVFPPEIVMHDAYISGRSENNIKCVVVHNDLGRKNRTTLYICCVTGYERFSQFFSCGTYSVLSWSHSYINGICFNHSTTVWSDSVDVMLVRFVYMTTGQLQLPKQESRQQKDRKLMTLIFLSISTFRWYLVICHKRSGSWWMSMKCR